MNRETIVNPNDLSLLKTQTRLSTQNLGHAKEYVLLERAAGDPFAFVENNISLLVLQTIVWREIPRVEICNFVVVERPPAPSRFILDERDVMSASKRSANMPDHSVGIIHIRSVHSGVTLDTRKLRRPISGFL